MHVHCLHWLMSTGLLSLNADHVNPRLVKWHQRRAPSWLWGSDMAPMSVHVCLGLIVEYWPSVSASTRHSYSKLYYLCLISSLIKLLPPPTPPCAPPTHPLIYTGPILMNSIKKIVKNCQKPAIIHLSGYLYKS